MRRVTIDDGTGDSGPGAARVRRSRGLALYPARDPACTAEAADVRGTTSFRVGEAPGIAARQALRHPGRPEDAGAFAAARLRDEAAGAAGQVTGADGGRSAPRAWG